MLSYRSSLIRFALAAVVTAVWLAYPPHATIRAQRGTVPPHHPRLDFDGDGRTDWAIQRPEFPTGAGGMIWHILNGAGYTGLQWGIFAGDSNTPGDFDGDGRADITVYRFSEHVFYARLSSTGALLSASRSSTASALSMAGLRPITPSNS